VPALEPHGQLQEPARRNHQLIGMLDSGFDDGSQPFEENVKGMDTEG
jgi:hypothetical protein